MKYLFTSAFVFFIIFQSTAQSGQNLRFRRNINFKTFDKDSIVLSLNSEYYLIEDSCAQITRYGHFDFKNKIFTGVFKDVSNVNTNLVVSEGNYTSTGLKDGEFTSHYLNGTLQSKGTFENNKFKGKWELYYDNGKPELTFDATNNDIEIIDEWQPDGKKVIDNGTGVHIIAAPNSLYWTGKLINGKPDGTWKYINANDITKTPIVTESFKKGVFRKGGSTIGEYTDSSRIVLVNQNLLPFINAERMLISREACDGSGLKNVVNAQYREGINAFSEKIQDYVGPNLSKTNIPGSGDYGYVTIHGEINVKGFLVNLSGDHSTELVRQIILGLEELPALQPATIDGKPVKQNFTITFQFQPNGLYRLVTNFCL